MNLQPAGDMKRHFFNVGGRKGLKTVFSALLDEVVEGLLSSKLHGQTLGAVFGRGQCPESCRFKPRNQSGRTL